MKIKLSSIVRIAISLGLLGFLFWLMRDDLGGLWGTLISCRGQFLILAAVLLIVNVTILSYRLKIIFLGENLSITLNKSAQLSFIGYFFNNFMPTAIGGDIIKAYYAGNDNNKKVESYASVLMDRLIGLYSYLIIAAVALILDGGRFQVPVVRPLAFTLLVLGFAGFAIIINPGMRHFIEKVFRKLKMFRLGEKLESIYNIVHDYRNRKRIVLEGLIVSIIAQCVYFSIIYIFFLALGAKISIGNIFLIMPVVTFISMIPSIGGLGVREGAMVALFTPLVGKETAFASSLLFLCGLIFVSFIGGVIYLWWGFSGARKVKEAKAEIAEIEEHHDQ
ncbi:MAG: flippase-like domain-containing protein [Candidatus Omnitrophica bacterium]|nr:flippase-like domain-containing protein [Candidatus Omnitrophota bacterium]